MLAEVRNFDVFRELWTELVKDERISASKFSGMLGSCFGEL